MALCFRYRTVQPVQTSNQHVNSMQYLQDRESFVPLTMEFTVMVRAIVCVFLLWGVVLRQK